MRAKENPRHLVPSIGSRQPCSLAEVRACLAPGGRLALVTAPLPPPWSLALWVSAGFDTAMWVRNRLRRPPFVMYYLTFMWPAVRGRLLAAGFGDVEVARGALAAPFESVLIVTARR